MLSHLLTQLLRSFGIFFRTIRAFFTRRLVGVWARLKRMTNFSRQATKVAADSLQSAATIAKSPTSRSDYVETKRLFISKKFLLTLAVGLLALTLLAYFVAWPFILGHFLTAHFYVEDPRVETWTGRVVVYSDEEKTIPLYEGKLEEGLLQGKGKEYDEKGLVIYEGSFVDSLREGKGKEYEAGVIRYDGDFAADVYEGDGELYEDGVLLYEGEFSGGVRAGEGSEFYPDGEIHYKGSFADDLYEGEGSEYNEDGDKIYQGGFSQGLYSGEGSLYPARDERIDATFAEGEPDGSIQWYKSGKIYYDGEADGITPSGFGTLYTQGGKTAYAGQMAGGTVDGAWLTTLTAAEFRQALGETAPTEYDNVSGGFIISSPALGLAALCSYQTEDAEPAVHTIYLSEPQEERFALLPDGEHITLDDWPEPVEGTSSFQQVKGVSLPSGSYDSESYELETCRAQVLYRDADDDDREAVLLTWSLPTALTGTGAAGGEQAQAAAEEQARMEEFLASLDLIDGAVSSQVSAQNPYYGTASVGSALTGCASASDAADAIDAMLTYWENAEKRASLEDSLTRTQDLLRAETNAQANGTGNAQTLAALESQQNQLSAAINTCIGEMSKASMQASAAGGGDPSKYDLSGLSVLFDPTTLSLDAMTQAAVSYAQSTVGAGSVDASQLALTLKTTLADLVTAHSQVQTALSAYLQAASAASSASEAYAMGAGDKAGWYSALSARADSQNALYAAMSSFTKQTNALNELTGGWVSRTQGWMNEALAPLYGMAANG